MAYDQQQSVSCALIYGFCEHHLDHIAPLCSFLQIPLYVTEPCIEEKALSFYPNIQVRYCQSQDIADHLMQYQQVLTALPKDLFDALFFLHRNAEMALPKNIWCPHGNSDKGLRSFFTEALRKESVALVYGQTMLEYFSSKKALNEKCKTIQVGSYRYNFYRKHQKFYQEKATLHFLSKLSSKNKTILYAPTWADSEGFCSVSMVLKPLLENKPQDLNLIIKLHPNTLLDGDCKIQQLVLRYESCPNIVFIENFPPIYPLLAYTDLYLGDSSSIGYDMLHFKKPMLFINILGSSFDLPLFQAGKVLYVNDLVNLYAHLRNHLLDQNNHHRQQSLLCNKTFARKDEMKKLFDLMTFSAAPSPCKLFV